MKMNSYETNYFTPEEHICHTRGRKIVNGMTVIEEDPFPMNVGPNSDHLLLTLDRATNKVKATLYFFIDGEWKEAE